ncbi:hypothetical protein [Ilumatobacter sp.]|uniref:hypothetical protein n=1 Tax=Ilumatobacter sp. TaxID=1967498 RepID=UPI003B5226ED
MNDDPLILEAGDALCLFEGHAGFDVAVVKAHDANLDLGDEHVLVVARIRDDRSAVGSPRRIVIDDPERLAVGFVQERVRVWATPVHRVQVEPWGAEVERSDRRIDSGAIKAGAGSADDSSGPGRTPRNDSVSSVTGLAS